MAMRRQHFGVLSRPEQYCISGLIGRLPQYVLPDHLTALALGGAAIAALALIGGRLSGWFLVLFYLGLIANWFGDSFDGALARHRRIERHRVGFLLDRTSDILSFVVIILALGLSPYLTLDAALMLLVAYLVHAIYALMRTVVDGVQIIGFGGVGATEGRVFIGVWVGVVQFADIRLASASHRELRRLPGRVCGAAGRLARRFRAPGRCRRRPHRRSRACGRFSAQDGAGRRLLPDGPGGRQEGFAAEEQRSA